MFGFGQETIIGDDALARVLAFVASRSRMSPYIPVLGTNMTDLTTAAKLLVEVVAFVRSKELELVSATDTTAITILRDQITQGKAAASGMWRPLYEAWRNAEFEVRRGGIEYIAIMKSIYNLLKDVFPALIVDPSEITFTTGAAGVQEAIVRPAARPELYGIGITPFAGEPTLWFPNLLSAAEQASLIAKARLDAVYAKIENMRMQLNAARGALENEKDLLNRLIAQAQALGIQIT